MTLSLRLGRGETPGWIYSPATPGFFFTGGYCCRVATAKFTVMGGARQGAIPIANTEQFFEETWSVLAPVTPCCSPCEGSSAFNGPKWYFTTAWSTPSY